MARPWNEKRDALLKDCLAQRMSFSEVAASINHAEQTQFSRNAVIGRVRRIGVPVTTRTRAPKPVKPKVNPAANGAAQRIFAKVSGALAPVVPFTPRAEPSDHRPLLIGLMDLTGATCRWPYGDKPPFAFCGCRTAQASPYCEEHKRMAAPKPTTPEERERRRMHGEMLARAGRKASQAARAWR